MKAQKRVFLLAFSVLFLLVLGSISTATSDLDQNLWTVNKTADVENLILARGQHFQVNYTITVDLQDYTRYPDPPYMGLNVADLTYDIFLGHVDLEGLPLPYTNVFPAHFYYSHFVGPYSECGDYIVENTAYICNGTTHKCSISIHVPCFGCTLTPGYWKTHSEHGPAPYDDAWALLGPDGADTVFFLSGQTWYEVLWTPPVKGNAYYILAQAYIAARLNILNETESTYEVGQALSWAEAFFASNTPDQGLPKSLRQEAIAFATYLDNYNNGLIGPGHCSEEAIK
jgi:hypothetical protein